MYDLALRTVKMFVQPCDRLAVVIRFVTSMASTR